MFSLLRMALSSSLSPNFYDHVCPQAFPTLKRVVEDVVKQESRISASLLCLHFHDCFVNGCGASILLDKTATIDSEKTVIPNNNYIRGFDVINKIKSEVDKCCGYPIVSCTDIVAVAARDSVNAISRSGFFHEHLGGPTCVVPLVRRDSTTASRMTTNNDIPAPFMDLPALIKNINKQGLDEKDIIALSGGHTIGFAQCFNFRNLIYNENNIGPSFASQHRANCPRSGGDSKLAPLDLLHLFLTQNILVIWCPRKDFCILIRHYVMVVKLIILLRNIVLTSGVFLKILLIL
ncbi:hypothetical protein P3S67_021150 [Capsicum chacoense]